MTKHFLRELEQLKRDVLVIGGQAETAVARAMRAFMEVDPEAADEVIEGDRETNALELRIEEECLKILSLYAPTAKDLRFVVGVVKITNDLERVADLAVNIAERARDRGHDELGAVRGELGEMAERVRHMLHAALDSFLQQDSEQAREVLAMDDRVDALLRGMYEGQTDRVYKDATCVDASLRILSTAKSLERIADHSTNIAEDVIYMATGDQVKHQP